jgi:hypothetical protein
MKYVIFALFLLLSITSIGRALGDRSTKFEKSLFSVVSIAYSCLALYLLIGGYL